MFEAIIGTLSAVLLVMIAMSAFAIFGYDTKLGKKIFAPE